MAVILLLDQVGDPEVEVEVEVGVQDARIIGTPTSTGRIGAVVALAVMKGDHDMDITSQDHSIIHYTLCITTGGGINIVSLKLGSLY